MPSRDCHPPGCDLRRTEAIDPPVAESGHCLREQPAELLDRLRFAVVLGEVGDYAYTGEDGLERVERDFLVRVDGDLSRPRLEAGKHTEYRWLGPDDLAVLDENREINDGMIRRIAEDGFAVLRMLGL